ncbi:polysialyltransferase family glycosyltransferase [Sulfurospirillum barnesii]|uniref:Glycosyltransferase family 52 n=1 Tax=Sulfurospirillum barnesii (strain ATCC 700032 / DSM 10660 / SES-3) TaxID=760154 RepID=I3XZ05_SULBS|nr:polysialyltransferase family glycosyltransferase [Sulfurospirillum barnesii]AFL69179.1 hypothetical protein Sulba_1899 [Sulfurospirillum barnesii SES-3]
MKNLFIIRSPLQILNAYEAIAHFELKHNIFLIVQNHLEKNNVQMREMLSMCEYEELIEMPPSKSNYFRYVALTLKLKKQRYNFIFFGNLGSFQKLLLANLEYEKSYLLEDGTSTLVFHKELSEEKQHVSWRDIRFLLAGLHIKRKKPVDYFTIFDLERKGKEEIVQHSFEYLKLRFCQKFLLTNEIYFLGQNLVKSGWVSEEAYVYYIKTIKNYFKNEKIIYIPHRAEMIDSKLRRIEDENFIIFENTMPIELYFMQQKIKPKKILSFYSTSLFTLAKIFDKTLVISYGICLENIKMKKKMRASFIEKFILHAGIEKKEICFHDIN